MAKKLMQMDDEREQQVLAEIVDMYIKNGGEMPSSRDVKKNKYISEAEVDHLRRIGLNTETRIRRMAEEKTGQKYASAEERRRQAKQERAKLAQEAKAEAEARLTEKKPRSRQRQHTVTREAVLADLRAMTEQLGRIPTCAEIQNSATYSYTTYLHKLGPKKHWLELLKLN